jgi:hypothetical protein
VSIISIVDDHEQAQFRHRRVDGVPTTDDHDRCSREAPQELCVSLGANLVAIPEDNVVSGDHLAQSLAVRLKIAPIGDDDYGRVPRSEGSRCELRHHGCSARSGSPSRTVVHTPGRGECPLGSWSYELV